MSRKKMWLGTQHHSQWVNPPLSGADMSPQGWGSEGSFLSGGAFVRQSQDSHRQYILEWGGTSSREAAEYMQSLRDGVYSKTQRDLIYFIDPLIEDLNILPKRWAQPGIVGSSYGAVTATFGTVAPTPTPDALVGSSGLPFQGVRVASYFGSLAQFTAVQGPGSGCVWVPIPPGRSLSITAWTDDPQVPGAGLYLKTKGTGGAWKAPQQITPSGLTVSGSPGALIAVVGLVNFYGAVATLASNVPSKWSSGLGHSGCRFVGNPTWVANSGVNGGQIGYAATLKEVGDWLL